MEVLFYSKIFTVILFMNSIKCQNQNQLQDNETGRGQISDSSELIPSFGFVSQNSTENPNSSVESSDYYTEESLHNETQQSLETIEDIKLITKTELNISTESSLSKTTKSPVNTVIYIWIAIAVFYVIFVVIALICILKSFCELNQNENIEDKRVTDVAAILERGNGIRTEAQQNIGGTLSLSPNEVKDPSVRSKTPDIPPEDTTTSNEVKKSNSKTALKTSSPQTTQLKEENILESLPVNKIKNNVSKTSSSNSYASKT